MFLSCKNSVCFRVDNIFFAFSKLQEVYPDLRVGRKKEIFILLSNISNDIRGYVSIDV